MSFTRFRKNKSKAGSAQDNVDYAECMAQKDNISQHSHYSEQQVGYNSRQHETLEQKITSQEDPKNLLNKEPPQKREGEGSASTSSSADGQWICDNCINQALMYAKDGLKDNYQYGESSLDIQDRLNALQRKQIEDRVRARQNQSDQVAKILGKATDKDLLQRENEKGQFFKDNDDLLRLRVMENYNRIDALNAKSKKMPSSVDEYYRTYVDGYNPNAYGNDEDDEEARRALQQKYNKELQDQIDMKRKLQNKLDMENRKYGAYDDGFEKGLEEDERLRRLRNAELNKANRDLIEARRKRAQNEKMRDELNDRKNYSDLQKKFADEAERERYEEEMRKRGWQKALQDQIDDKARRLLMERERDRNMLNENRFADFVCECDPNGRCCCCKRIYPMANLNPRKKYAALVRIQKQRRQREMQKQVEGQV